MTKAGDFVLVNDDSLPKGWIKKVYQLDGRLVRRWSLWYDRQGKKFVSEKTARARMAEESMEDAKEVVKKDENTDETIEKKKAMLKMKLAKLKQIKESKLKQAQTLNEKLVKTKSESKKTIKALTVSDKSDSDKPVSNKPTKETSPKQQKAFNTQTESKSKVTQYSTVSINVDKNPLSLKADLKENVKTETNETKKTAVKAFNCDNCEKGFNIKSNLLAHSKLYCEKKAIEESIPIVIDKANIISKEDATATANGYNCRWCKKDFATRRNVSRHEKDSCPDKNETTTRLKENVLKNEKLQVNKAEQERGEGYKETEKENAQQLIITEKVTDTESLDCKQVDNDTIKKVQSMIHEEEKITEMENENIKEQEEEKLTVKVDEKITDKEGENITDEDEQKITDEEDKNIKEKEEEKIADKEEEKIADEEEEKIAHKEDKKFEDKEEDKFTEEEEEEITDEEDEKIIDKEEHKITDREDDTISNKEDENITDYEENEIEILAEFEHSSKDIDIDMDEDISDDEKNVNDDDENEISSKNEDMDMDISEDEEDLDETIDSGDVAVIDSPSMKHKLGNEELIKKKDLVDNVEHKENSKVNEAINCVEERKDNAEENQESMEEEQECLFNDNDLTEIEVEGGDLFENQHDSTDDEGEGQESLPFEQDTMKLEPCLVEEVKQTTKHDTKLEEQEVEDLVAEHESMDGDQDLEEQASLHEKQDSVNEAEQKEIDVVGEERESIDEEQDYVVDQQALEDNEQDSVVLEQDCSEGDLVEKQLSKSDEGSKEWDEALLQSKDDKKDVAETGTEELAGKLEKDMEVEEEHEVDVKEEKKTLTVSYGDLDNASKILDKEEQSQEDVKEGNDKKGLEIKLEETNNKNEKIIEESGEDFENMRYPNEEKYSIDQLKYETANDDFDNCFVQLDQALATLAESTTPKSGENIVKDELDDLDNLLDKYHHFIKPEALLEPVEMELVAQPFGISEDCFSSQKEQTGNEMNLQPKIDEFVCKLCGDLFEKRKQLLEHLKLHKARRLSVDQGEEDEQTELVALTKAEKEGLETEESQEAVRLKKEEMVEFKEDEKEVKDKWEEVDVESAVMMLAQGYGGNKRMKTENKSVQQDSMKIENMDVDIKMENMNQLIQYSDSLSCVICDKQFKSKMTLSTHKKTMHEGLHFKCDQCDHKAKSRINLKYHIQSKHTDTQFECDKCNHTSNTMGSMVYHKTKQHPSKDKPEAEPELYSCDVCDQRFKNLKIHKTRMHPSAPPSTPVQPQTTVLPGEVKSGQLKFADMLSAAMGVGAKFNMTEQKTEYLADKAADRIKKEPVINTDLLDFTFLSADEIGLESEETETMLFDEGSAKTETNDNTPEQMDFMFLSAEELNLESEKKIIIKEEMVEKSVPTYNDTIQMGERVVCLQCNLKFKGESGLKRHITVKHKEENKSSPVIESAAVEGPFECHFCKQVFKGSIVLNSHIARLHPRTNARDADEKANFTLCVLCPKTFMSRVELKLHKQAEHKDQRFPCPNCDFAGDTPNSLNNHLSMVCRRFG